MSLSRTIDFLRHLPKFSDLAAEASGSKLKQSVLSEGQRFGSNPGNLRMFSFVPKEHDEELALVVVLHGCTQTARSYDVGAGWSALAERYGFALLMPEQQSANNAKGCFNWFEVEDTKRDSGEALSIRQMIAQMTRDHNIDHRRIFVTGLSAGGAMTSVMLATYPDVFAAGAIIAGLPFGAAASLQEALGSMFAPATRSPEELGNLVRIASPHSGPWPKVSVWHGSADRTVNPSNADETVKQWLNVHDLPLSPMSTGLVETYPRKIWWNGDGETVVESFTITNMPHGTPLGAGDDDEQFGIEGAYLIAAGISSSFHIANFFGLTERIHKAKSSPIQVQNVPDYEAKAARQVLTPTLLPPSSTGQDVGEVIRRALTAAGLMR